jgi:hypothetical protein
VRLTEAMKKNMVADGKGNWVAMGTTELVESAQIGDSNAGMASARGFLHGNERSTKSPAVFRESIISGARAMGLSEAEAVRFWELGHKEN